MKKIALPFFLLTALASVHAQIDNGRFQDWAPAQSGTYTYDSLVNWRTTDLASRQNSSPSVHSATQETTDAYEGGSSINMTSWSTTGNFLNGVPGAASNGDVNVVIFPPSITPIGGVPDVVRHAALMGYYKYIPVGTDSGTIETWLYKRNGATRDIVAHGKFKFGASLPNVYTHFTLNLDESLPGNPDSSLIWMESSPREPLGSGQTGSVLKVDSIYYSGIIGVDEISPLVKSLMTYPVPASTELHVKVELVSPVSMQYEILDLSGQKVAAEKMDGTSAKIDLTNLAAGTYYVVLRDEAGKKLCSDKFYIVR